MNLKTTKFGEIQVDKDRVIYFEKGIPGFDAYKSYVLVTPDETSPFMWLQSIEDSDIALTVINPFLIMPSYNPEVLTYDIEEIKGDDIKELVVLTVVVVPNDISKMTANFAAPIIINAKVNLAKQVIVQSDEYKVRHPVFDSVREYKEREVAG